MGEPSSSLQWGRRRDVSCAEPRAIIIGVFAALRLALKPQFVVLSTLTPDSAAHGLLDLKLHDLFLRADHLALNPRQMGGASPSAPRVADRIPVIGRSQGALFPLYV